MSQPASLKEPRDGETVLACKHDRPWKMKAVFVGHYDTEGNPTGLGMLVTGPSGVQTFIRWVVLCWACRVRRWVSRKKLLQLAAREAIWRVEKPVAGRRRDGIDPGAV